jgi:hypothetical protein
MPATRARTWATREASVLPGSSVCKPTVVAVTVTTPTSTGGGVLAGGGALPGPQPANGVASAQTVQSRRQCDEKNQPITTPCHAAMQNLSKKRA